MNHGGSTRHRTILLGLCVGILMCVAAMGADEGTSPTTFPPLPKLTLAPVNETNDIAAYRAGVRESVARFAGLADACDDPLLRAELRLAAVNLIFARQLEPDCTRTFWSLTTFEAHKIDRDAIETAFDLVDNLIETAQQDIEAARDAKQQRPDGEPPVEKGEPPAEKADDEIDPRQQRIQAARGLRRTLAAFGTALRAVVAPPADEDSDRGRRRAASKLAALVEEDDRRVAAAAEFWQAYLRKDEADPQPALSRLDYALDDFTPSERPYAFFARVLRCRVLAAHGMRVAALALLKQVEERTYVWFPQDAQQQAAASAVAWVEFQTLLSWHEQLDPQTQEEARHWCRTEAHKAVERSLTAHTALPRIWPAIPLLAELAELEAKAADNDSN